MSGPSSSPLPRLGRYEDLVLLGQGGMGAVYRARDPSLDRTVAIKVISNNRPDFVARFHREARAVAKLSHPNVVQIFDFGEDEQGNPYFVMELLRGRSLDKLLEQREAMSPFFFLEIAADAAQAEIVVDIQPAVLAGNNVVDLMREQRGLLREVAVFTDVAGTASNLLAPLLGDRHEAARNDQNSSA